MSVHTWIISLTSQFDNPPPPSSCKYLTLLLPLACIDQQVSHLRRGCWIRSSWSLRLQNVKYTPEQLLIIIFIYCMWCCCVDCLNRPLVLGSCLEFNVFVNDLRIYAAWCWQNDIVEGEILTLLKNTIFWRREYVFLFLQPTKPIYFYECSNAFF